MTVKSTPDGYHTVTPYLILSDASNAIDFYIKAFGASELMRLNDPGGKIAHAEIMIGNSPIMLADECPDMGFHSPETLGGTGVSMCVYFEDVDAVFEQAINLGARMVQPVQNQFYGDRSGTLADPYGHVWTLATHIEDLSPEEIFKRAERYFNEKESHKKS